MKINKPHNITHPIKDKQNDKPEKPPVTDSHNTTNTTMNNTIVNNNLTIVQTNVYAKLREHNHCTHGNDISRLLKQIENNQRALFLLDKYRVKNILDYVV